MTSTDLGQANIRYGGIKIPFFCSPLPPQTWDSCYSTNYEQTVSISILKRLNSIDWYKVQINNN